MRYLILKPKAATFDPREIDIPSSEALYEHLEKIADCATEDEAVSAVRRAFPGAIGMPMSIKIGAGTALLLAFVEDPAKPIDPDDTLPAVVFVQPVSESDTERGFLRRASVGKVALFDRKKWALRPVMPALSRTMPIEWRTSELETPVYLDARVGFDHAGHLVIYAEAGEHSFSVTFRQLVKLVDVDDHPSLRFADKVATSPTEG